MWCIPPEQNAEFVARMEDVLTVYKRPYDPDYPVVCMDEQPYQLLDNCVKPIPMSEDNHVEKCDYEYERKGSCAIFMFTEPLGCWRVAHARPTRTAVDWAEEMKWLLDEKYANAKKAFDQITFEGYEIAESAEWYIRKMSRDRAARREYFDVERNRVVPGDLFVTQILGEEMKADDPRLR